MLKTRENFWVCGFQNFEKINLIILSNRLNRKKSQNRLNEFLVNGSIVYVYIYTCVHAYGHIFIYKCEYTSVYIYTCVYIWTYICKFRCIYVCVYICTYVYVCEYIYMYIYIYICINIYTYTYILYTYIYIFIRMALNVPHPPLLSWFFKIPLPCCVRR